jgi:UDP-4-amino-4-deoxy-L-arabinose formyltransferase/UDP-glucuronic acid dehydrogenase (UDP-4-keto-hexauronic acid decarboxylating)
VTRLTIVLAAGESAGIRALRAVAASGHELLGVFAAAPLEGLRGADVASVAAALGLPVWPAERVRDPSLADDLRRASVDLLLNVYSLYVIHADVLAALRIGGFNLHPGPLPEYAGLNVVNWALYHGEPTHGVTLHWLEPRIDTGAIAAERRFPVGGDDTGFSLSARCVREGLLLVEDLLATAGRDPDAIPRVPQDLARRRYFRPGPPREGRIAWDEPGQRVVGLVRACDYGRFPSPWGSAWTRGPDEELRVTGACLTAESTAGVPPGTVGEPSSDGVPVAAADRWVLVRSVAGDAGPRDPAQALPAGARLV